MHRLYWSLAACVLAVVATGEITEETAKKYPASLEEVPAELRYPVGAKVSVDKDGNYTVNGKVRWFLGTQPHTENSDCLPTPGYPASLKWIYEKLIDLDTAQRIGFDSLAPYASNRAFVERLVPGHPAAKPSQSMRDTVYLHANTGLPIQVDLSAGSDVVGRGMLMADKPEWNAVRSKDAVNHYFRGTASHWVPYNAFHPDARKIYRAYWEAGVDEYRGKSPVLCYELFNEPGYNDLGEYNRKLFAEWLRKKYRTPEAMNRNWNSAYPDFEAAANFKNREENGGLGVDWTKFMEMAFTDLCVFGHQVVTAKVPGAWISVQPMGTAYRLLFRANTNMYEINKHLTAISLPTGGGIGCSNNTVSPKHSISTPANAPNLNEGIFQRHFFRNLGEGKPILNGELYTGKKAATIRYQLWQDLLRGCNASYAFAWYKRANIWKPRNEEGGKIRANREGYHLLNPYSEIELFGLMEAKKEIFRFGDYFMPRERGEDKCEVAVFFSHPTERKALTNGNVTRHDCRTYAGALEYSHYPMDVILEEQLPEKRWNRYKAIVAAGVLNVYDQTPAELTEFMEKGGVLILSRHYMTENEYGHPADWKGVLNIKTSADDAAKTAEIASKLKQPELLPGKIMGRNTNPVVPGPGWETLATAKDKPVVLRKQVGKGWLYLVTAEMQDYYIAAILGGILGEHGIQPKAQLKRPETNDLAVNVELFTARRNGNTLHFLLNADRYPKLVDFFAPGLGNKRVYSLLDNRELTNREGSVRVFLPGEGYTIIGYGDDESLEREFGKCAPLSVEETDALYREKLEAFDREVQAANANAFRYNPDLSRTRTIDLREFCNRGFTDSVAEDGKGGWTDQGRENSLTDVPWGVHTLLGVPCDLIRFDMNNDKTCIVLFSETQKEKLPEIVPGIRIGGKIRAIYFFHTVAFRGTIGVIYRIHYASGKTLDVEAEVDKHIGDWWIGNATRKITAFENRQKRGFQCMEWVNPNPEDEILSLDIVSPKTKVVPIVIGVTVEEYVPKKVLPFGDLRGGVSGKAATLAFQGDTCEVSITPQSKPYTNFSLAPADRNRVFQLSPEEVKNGELVFEVNGGKDVFGNPKGGDNVKVGLIRSKTKEGKRAMSATCRVFPFIKGKRIDDRPETFQTVRIPLTVLKFQTPDYRFDSVFFQYNGPPQCGLIIRNLRLEITE